MAKPSFTVDDYDRDWSRRAEALIASVMAMADATVERVEHIGSTAIPGMAAKNVIDLQASVADLDRAADALEGPLTAIGFERLPYEHDHVPAGLVDDPERWVKRMFARRDHPDGRVNLHVRLVGSPNERFALLFRDWFLAHPEAVPAYAEFKRVLASEVDDVGVYSDIKDPVVDLVIVVAETWAAITDWNPNAPR